MMEREVVAHRLRALVAAAEEDATFDPRTLRAELEALGRSLYQRDAPDGTEHARAAQAGGPGAETVGHGSPASVVVERRIDWADTDASGHWYFGAALRLAESAEVVLQNRLGIDPTETFGRTPRVNIAITYVSVLRAHELVEVRLAVAAVGRTSVTYHFDIHRGRELMASGAMTAVLLDRSDGRPTPWPVQWREQLQGGGSQDAERLASTSGRTPTSS
jgi:acyl-CoA thioesterase FadM